MTTARSIIDGALFKLNKLAIGESADSAVDTVCLRELNTVVDEINGAKGMLFREVITSSGSTVSTATATLGSTWSGISPGDKILGASYSDGTNDWPMREMTMAQYQAIPDKATTGTPDGWAHDGLATVYFAPVPTGQTIKIRTRVPFTDFADATTDYSMPKGYKSAFIALLAEALGPVFGGITQAVVAQARAARMRLLGQTVKPAILDTDRSGRVNIFEGI